MAALGYPSILLMAHRRKLAVWLQASLARCPGPLQSAKLSEQVVHLAIRFPGPRLPVSLTLSTKSRRLRGNCRKARGSPFESLVVFIA